MPNIYIYKEVYRHYINNEVFITFCDLHEDFVSSGKIRGQYLHQHISEYIYTNTCNFFINYFTY